MFVKSVPAADLIGELWTFEVSGVEIFSDIAEATSIGFVELRAANPGVDAWIPPAGTKVLIPAQHLLPDRRDPGMVINLGDLRLYLFDKNGELQGTWPIGVGRAGRETPLGTYRVTELRTNPTWYPTKTMREADPEMPVLVRPGPSNPLGDFAIRIGWDGYAVHGTNRPAGVGRMVSSGCIRLYPADIKELFSKAAVGDNVVTIDQPIKIGWHDNALYLEAHPDTDQVNQIEATGTFDPSPTPDLKDRISKIAATEPSLRIDWAKVDQVAAERKGIPSKISLD